MSYRYVTIIVGCCVRTKRGRRPWVYARPAVRVNAVCCCETL